MGKKFLQEGADFLDAAVDWENEKNRVHGKYAGIPLQESTLRNLVSLQSVDTNSVVIGKFLANAYNKETFDTFIKGLQEGYRKGTEGLKYDEEEKERVAQLFEQHFKDGKKLQIGSDEE